MKKRELKMRREELNLKTAQLVSAAMNYMGLNIADFSKKFGRSQSYTSLLLSVNNNNTGRNWSIDNLILLSDFFGVSLSTMVREVERYDGVSVPIFFHVARTKPRSHERLQALVWAAVHYKVADDPRGSTRKTYDVSLMEQVIPEFVGDYLAGKLSDNQAFAVCQQADMIFRNPSASSLMLYGHAIKQVYLGVVSNYEDDIG